MVGDNIRKFRDELGLTQEELANKINVSRGYIAQLERGSKALTVPIAMAMAEVFQIDINDLIKLA